MVLAAELSPANDEKHRLHEVHDKAAGGNTLAQGALHDQTDSSAGLNLAAHHRIDDLEVKTNDSTAVM